MTPNPILRRSAERGFADHGWLQSFHSFSFADYHDPAHMGVGNLRVLNEDRIAPGSGFGTHAHRDMEIVSWVLDGELAHRDSIGAGTAGVIRPGEAQRMSAGTGVRHSEFNHAEGRTTHFLQIWLLPDRAGIAPGYEQKSLDPQAMRGAFALLASPDGADGSVTVHADARLRVGRFDGTEVARVAVDPARPQYVHVARGRVRVNDQTLDAGDAITLRGVREVVVDGGDGAEVLHFDLRP